MTITDWSAIDADQLAVLYAEESRRWRTAFDWDTADQWRILEDARTRWNLPGLVARDRAGRLSGWLFYLQTPAGAQLGGVSATDAETTRALVEAFVEQEASGSITGFMPDLAPGLDEALAGAGLFATPHLFLAAALVAVPANETTAGRAGRGWANARFECDLKRYEPGVVSMRPGSARNAHRPPATGSAGVRLWRPGDDSIAAHVLREAYDSVDAALFAPDGTIDEWRAYVTSLVEQIGCGRFMREASLVSETDGRATGVAVVTRLSERMAHIAQIAVRREQQGSGDGARLLSAAMSAAHEAGAAAMSLLVSSRNEGALRFYARHGLVERGRFLEISAARPAAGVLRAS